MRPFATFVTEPEAVEAAPLGCVVRNVNVTCGVLTLPAPLEPPVAEGRTTLVFAAVEESTTAIHFALVLQLVPDAQFVHPALVVGTVVVVAYTVFAATLVKPLVLKVVVPVKAPPPPANVGIGTAMKIAYLSVPVGSTVACAVRLPYAADNPPLFAVTVHVTFAPALAG
jgi:hypothetical protein